LSRETGGIINHADSRNDHLPISEASEKEYSSLESDIAHRTAPIYRRDTYHVYHLLKPSYSSLRFLIFVSPLRED